MFRSARWRSAPSVVSLLGVGWSLSPGRDLYCQRCRERSTVRRAERSTRPARSVCRQRDGDFRISLRRDRDLPPIALPVDPSRPRHRSRGYFERLVTHRCVAVADRFAQGQVKGERGFAVVRCRHVFDPRRQRRVFDLLRSRAEAAQMRVFIARAVLQPPARVVALVESCCGRARPVGRPFKHRRSSSQVFCDAGARPHAAARYQLTARISHHLAGERERDVARVLEPVVAH